MEKKDLTQKQMRRLCVMCCLLYSVSYLTRLSYTVCLVEIRRDLQIGESLAGLPVTAFFFTYGAGQILCGWLGGRYSPRKMAAIGLAGSALCNLAVGFLSGIQFIIPVWCANGFFQSMLWPPLVRIMAETLNDFWYRKGCVWVSLSSSGATAALYLLTPSLLAAKGFRAVLCLAAVTGIITSLIWYAGTGPVSAIKPVSSGKTPAARTGAGIFSGIPIGAILAAIAVHGALKDGIAAWMPVYMTEIFGMSSSGSILSTAVLPLCSVCGTMISAALFDRLKNELLTAALLFAAGTIAGLAMLPVCDSRPAVCMAMMTLITGCMYGINLMLISRIPRYFAGRGNISVVSGILNAATYAGSSLGTWGSGAIAENTGWVSVVSVWSGTALAGALFLMSGVRRWSAAQNSGKEARYSTASSGTNTLSR